MAGGGGRSSVKGPAYQPVQPHALQPVPTAQLQTTGYGGMGYTPVANPFTAQGAPAWMQGWYSMPSWGVNAATGQPLTQEQLQVQQPEPPPPAPQQQQPPVAPRQQVPGQPAKGPKDPADEYRRWRNNTVMRSISRPGGLDADTGMRSTRQPDTSYGAYLLSRPRLGR